MLYAFWRLLNRKVIGVLRKMLENLIVQRNSQRATVSNTHWMAKARKWFCKPTCVYTWYFSPQEWPQKKLSFKSWKGGQRTVSMEWTTPLLTGKSKSTTKASLSSPAWKRTLCIIGPQGGEQVQKNFLRGRGRGGRRSEVNHHRLVKPRLQVSKSFRNLIYGISCVFGMGTPLFFWKKVLPFHS